MRGCLNVEGETGAFACKGSSLLLGIDNPDVTIPEECLTDREVPEECVVLPAEVVSKPTGNTRSYRDVLVNN
jgi:hypothetical protein